MIKISFDQLISTVLHFTTLLTRLSQCSGPVTEEIPFNITCKDDEYACTGIYGGKVLVENCIHIDYMCDGDFDCDSGNDEEDCGS